MRDKRVRLFRQATNIGPEANFRFVLEQASGKYFMWAADDDTWEPSFVERLVDLLESDESLGVAFCNFDALDREGRRAEIYPDFLPLLQAYERRPIAARLAAYISQEEYLGKANLIYGLFRRSVLKSSGGMRAWGLGGWGSDMLSTCAVLARADVAIDPELLYHVGIEPLEVNATRDPVVRPPNWPGPVRVIRAIGRHMGYMLGYARIVYQAKGLTRSERVALFSVILRRFATLARREVAAARVPSFG